MIRKGRASTQLSPTREERFGVDGIQAVVNRGLLGSSNELAQVTCGPMLNSDILGESAPLESVQDFHLRSRDAHPLRGPSHTHGSV